MSDNEKLIEEARAFADRDNGLNWQGRIRELADALEAAKKAHTPTDDEREALANLVQLGFVTDWYEAADRILAAGFRRTEVPEPSAEHAYQGNRSQDTCWVMVDGEMCRKPVEAHVGTQGEPSERELFLERTITDLGEELQIAREGRAAAIEVLNQHRCGEQAEAAYRRAVQAESRPQGEPSDAQVEAAHTAFWEHPDITGGHDAIRAALRAAGGVR